MEKFGSYELLSLVGEGGMGRVYRARDTRYDRIVALKVMGTEATSEPDFEKWFRREAELVTRLNSSNIVPIHGYGEIEGRPYLDMRYVDGMSLSGVVRKYGPASLDVALDVINYAASALDDAHAAGVVHRDVKPANLLIDRKGFVYLADFGIAIAARSRGSEGARLFGSWAYMAPERFVGSEVGPETDIYSLACVLYFALTGSPPFHGDSLAEWKNEHLYRQPPSLCGQVPEVTPQVDDVIRWALAKNPAERPKTATEWTERLRQAHEGISPGPAPIPNGRYIPVGPPEPMPMPRDDSTKTYVLLAVLVALVILVGALAALAANS